MAMPALTSVGSVHFQSLPALDVLNLTSGITIADSIFINDTLLSSIAGIEVVSVGDFSLTGNHRLGRVDLPIRNITGDFIARFNGARTQIYLPDLPFAKSLNITHVLSFEAPQLETIEKFAQFDNNFFTSLTIPRLRSIEGLVRFDYNNDFTSLSFPELEYCGDLIITNSLNLSSISLPALKAINGQLSITNSTMLAVIDGFKKLTTVEANVKVRGLLSE